MVVDGENIFKIIKKDNKDYISNCVNNNPMLLIESMLDLSKKTYGFKKEYSNIIKEVLLLIVTDICNNEGCKYSDIKLISDYGNYSVVFEIGNKVIKLGNERENISFPLNPYIITPLMRRYIEDAINDSKVFVEVEQKVKIDYIPRDKFYDLYKGIRDLGLIWTDVNCRNVGVLQDDNIIHWKGNLSPNYKELLFTEKIGDIILKKGDLVVLDADHIYYEEDDNIALVDDSYYAAFEYQYRLDKKI